MTASDELRYDGQTAVVTGAGAGKYDHGKTIEGSI